VKPTEDQSGICRFAILGTRGIPAQYGGFETFAEKLSIGLRQRGVAVTVFCEAQQSVARNSFNGVHLRYVAVPPLGPLKTILYDVLCLWSARKDFDVVYMLGYGAAPFCLIPRFYKTSVWINPDGLEWTRAKWGIVARMYLRLMEWMCLWTSNRIIADADAIAASLKQRYGTVSHATVIPYGCEIIQESAIDPVLEWGLTHNGYYLVVCRLEPENHILEMLQAFQASKSKKCLIVVGNHAIQTQYVRQLLAVKDTRIRLVGPQYDQAKLSALRFHSFGYFHGHSVGGTNPSLLEAMGCGNLIFAHDNPFNRETLGQCGLFFANSRELTEAIEHAECGGDEVSELRHAAKVRAETHYQWADIVSRYWTLLQDTISFQKGPHRGP